MSVEEFKEGYFVQAEETAPWSDTCSQMFGAHGTDTKGTPRSS